jgi:hypothetical protein
MAKKLLVVIGFREKRVVTGFREKRVVTGHN